jgi:hypothetical protein
MTTKQNLLSRLLGRQQQVEQKAARDFHSFVVQVADGDVTDADKILDALQRMGETPLTLQQEINKLAERRAWQERLKDEEKVTKRLRETEAKQAAIIKTREAIRAAWKVEDNDLSVELGQLMATVSGYESIRAKLRNSFADDGLKSDEKQLIARKQELHAEAREIRKELAIGPSGYSISAHLSGLRSMKRVAEQNLREAKDKRQKANCEEEVQELGQKIAATEKNQKPLHDRLERIQAECEVIDREQHAIDEAKILVA